MKNIKKYFHEGYYCPHCGIYIYPYEEVYLKMGNIVACESCYNETDIWNGYDCVLPLEEYTKQPFIRGGEY